MFTRADTSLLGRWWWTIDRWILISILMLITIGIILVFAASPAVASKIGLSSFYFVKRHIIYMTLGLILMVLVSLLNHDQMRVFAAGLLVLMTVGVISTLFLGATIKGAKRWLNVGGLSIQPTEFIKPALTLLCAWLFAEQKDDPRFPGTRIAIILVIFELIFILLQPDVGTSVLIVSVFVGQFVLAGLPLLWIVSTLCMGAGGLLSAYFIFPHVAQRIDRFLYASQSDKFAEGYQITQSLEALRHGSWFGRGPGEGIIKKNLPDAHADFIFAVAGEEFGIILCMVLTAIFAFVLLRVMSRLRHESSFFVVLAVSGLVSQFILQAVINMASAVHLIPTKGMTLPFVSYGGSSVLAISITMGLLLGLTRRTIGGRPHAAV